MEQEFLLIGRYLNPAEAMIVCGCLQAAGIDAIIADHQHVQADLLLAPAIGGARVLVPAADFAHAQAVLAARERGELALGDDDDVGGAQIYPFRPRG